MSQKRIKALHPKFIQSKATNATVFDVCWFDKNKAYEWYSFVQKFVKTEFFPIFFLCLLIFSYFFARIINSFFNFFYRNSCWMKIELRLTWFEIPYFPNPGPGFYLGQRTEKKSRSKNSWTIWRCVKNSSNRHAIVVNGHVYSVFSWFFCSSLIERKPG